jgi:hypothetical protein
VADADHDQLGDKLEAFCTRSDGPTATHDGVPLTATRLQITADDTRRRQLVCCSRRRLKDNDGLFDAGPEVGNNCLLPRDSPVNKAAGHRCRADANHGFHQTSAVK